MSRETLDRKVNTWLPRLQVQLGSGKKSIFAQKMAAKRAAEKAATAPSAAECVEVRSAAPDALDPVGSVGEVPLPGSRGGKWRRFCSST